MAFDLAEFLAVYGPLFDGNAVSLDPGYVMIALAAGEGVVGWGVYWGLGRCNGQ